MDTPRTFPEILRIFDNFPVSNELLEQRDISPDDVVFPLRTIPYPLVLSAIAVPTLEALMRNRKAHYAPAGARLAPANPLWMFDKLAPSLRDFKAGRASHAAVEQIYHHVYGIWRRDTLVQKFTALLEDLTWNTDHALGLIGRFHIVRNILKNVLGSRKIRSMGSIACGSGEAVAEGLCGAPTDAPVLTSFFDINLAALRIARERTEK